MVGEEAIVVIIIIIKSHLIRRQNLWRQNQNKNSSIFIFFSGWWHQKIMTDTTIHPSIHLSIFNTDFLLNQRVCWSLSHLAEGEGRVVTLWTLWMLSAFG